MCEGCATLIGLWKSLSSDIEELDTWVSYLSPWSSAGSSTERLCNSVLHRLPILTRECIEVSIEKQKNER